MSRFSRTTAPTRWLLGGLTAAGALAAALVGAIGPPEVSIHGAPTRIEERNTVSDALDSAPEPRQTATRRPVLPAVPLAAEAAEPPPAEPPQIRATRAAASLAASLDPEVFRAGSFEIQARALAASLGPEEVQELANLAADPARGDPEVVAAAEILRHQRAQEGPRFPAQALGRLRSAWEARANDPVLAAAAVRALGAFGDPVDRQAMIAEVTEKGSASAAGLACAGLSAVRGDEAAGELVRALDLSADPRRSEIVLSALTVIASADDRELSDEARVRCAEALLRGAEPRAPGDPARHLSALAALDPELARGPLLAALSDAKSGPGTLQSAASALARIPEAAPELRAMLADGRLDETRRALAAETLLRSGADPWGEARSTLERVRDGRPGAAAPRRAARVLERADAALPAR